jgi:hypothetical protein
MIWLNQAYGNYKKLKTTGISLLKKSMTQMMSHHKPCIARRDPEARRDHKDDDGISISLICACNNEFEIRMRDVDMWTCGWGMHGGGPSDLDCCTCDG